MYAWHLHTRLVDLVHALVSLQMGMTHVQHLYTRLYTSVLLELCLLYIVDEIIVTVGQAFEVL